ncbi:MAG: fibronectin type III-like domain-contianing protein [Anaerolineales bacterium]
MQLQIGREAFHYYDPSKGEWIVEPGRFEIRVGDSSRNLPLRAEVTVVGRRGT